MPETRETILEIDLSALSHNYNYLRSRIPASTLFLAVVKAYAYGHDAVNISRFLQKLGVDYFAVAYTAEGILLRENGISKPIMVLHPQPVNFKLLTEYQLEPSLYSINVLRSFIATCEKEKLNEYPIHIKFNTGLNRLGFLENDADLIHQQINNTGSVKVKSILSHLAASEDLNEKELSLNQINSFNISSSVLTEKLGYRPMRHMCNTSGLLNYPQAHFDMVRSGIGLYGFGNSEEESKNLKPVASLKTIISQIHLIQEGETVGYNRAFRAADFTRTATIPIGHADGIGRQYGNGVGQVYIKGKAAPIIGNVCMDMIMVDVTTIDCEEGDEVIVFDKHHTAEDIASRAQTISYELITAVSPRVKRIYRG